MKTVIATMLCAGALLAGCSGAKTSAPEPGDALTLLVGSYSAPADSALKAYRFNPADGTAEYLCSMPVANASFLAFAPGGMVYAVTETDSTGSALTALRMASDGAGFEVLGRQPVGADSPCYVAVSPDGRFVATANYGDGTVAVFPLADGVPGPRAQLLRLEGSGPVEGRQAAPHAHCIAFTPDGRHMLVSDLGSDRIHSFALRGDGGGGAFVDETPDGGGTGVEPGSGPRHIVFNAAGDKAYLINELSDKVAVMDCGADGVLSPVQYIEADTAKAGGAADIHLSADGRRLYASLRLKHDGIAAFDVDSVSGRLSYAGHTPTGVHPRNFTFAPDGRHMLVACRDAGGVEVYAVDSATGALSLKGRIPQECAVFVGFMP